MCKLVILNRIDIYWQLIVLSVSDCLKMKMFSRFQDSLILDYWYFSHDFSRSQKCNCVLFLFQISIWQENRNQTDRRAWSAPQLLFTGTRHRWLACRGWIDQCVPPHSLSLMFLICQTSMSTLWWYWTEPLSFRLLNYLHWITARGQRRS